MAQLKLKKQNKIILFFILGLIYSCSSKLNQSFVQDKLGININLKKVVFNWGTGKDLQGEGFEMDVYDYSIKSKTDIIKSGYPILDEAKPNFNIATWEKTPVVREEFELVFDYNTKNKEVEIQLENAKEALNKKGNYCAYYYKYANNTNVVNSIDLCIIDIEKNKLYIITVAV
jgi:hypothetical protein